MVYPEKSQYYNKYAPCFDPDLKFFATIDDTVIRDMARQLNNQMPNRSTAYKAKALLNFFHQNFTYISDKDQFGIDDVWEFPAQVIKVMRGDCDGLALAYTSLAYNMGLDVMTLRYKDHMATAVCMEGKPEWDFYESVNKKYFIIDPSHHKSKVGLAVCKTPVIAFEIPVKPNESFRMKFTSTPQPYPPTYLQCFPPPY